MNASEADRPIEGSAHAHVDSYVPFVWRGHAVAATPAAEVPVPRSPASPWFRWLFAWLPTSMFPFLAMIVALGVAVVVQLVGLAVFEGRSAFVSESAVQAGMQSMVEDPIGFVIIASPIQLTFLGLVVLLALFSREGLTRRLALRRGAISPLWWPVLALSVPAVGMSTDAVTTWLGLEPSAHLQELVESIEAQSRRNVLLVVTLVAVLPGLAEELVFRGYVQSRLVRTWHPMLAIGFASVTFSAAHLDPQHILLVLPLGCWMGVISWRCQSIWPTVLGHFLNNLVPVLSLAGWLGEGPGDLAVGGFVLVFMTFAGVLLVFARHQPVATPEFLRFDRSRQDRSSHEVGAAQTAAAETGIVDEDDPRG